MINSIVIKNRKNSKSNFETNLILTEHAIKMLDPKNKFTTDIVELLEHMISFGKSPSNVQIEIVYKSLDGQRKKKEKSVLTNSFPNSILLESEWRSRYNILTAQEKKVFNLVLRSFKQQQICKILNIKLNTEKWYRKSIHKKIGLSNFSSLTDSEREFLLHFAH